MARNQDIKCMNGLCTNQKDFLACENAWKSLAEIYQWQKSKSILKFKDMLIQKKITTSY